MGERRGNDTDRLAIEDLFRGHPQTRDGIIENYLKPRARRNAREKLDDRRDHFWTVPPTATPEQRAAAAKGADPLVRVVEQRLLALKDTDWVSKATAAVYCGCSEPELDRRVRALGGLSTLILSGEARRTRKKDAQGNVVPGNITERRFKMSAVRRLQRTKGRSTPQHAASTAHSGSKAPAGKPISLKAALKDGALVLTLPKAMLDRVPWVVDASGEVVCHLTLTGLSATVIAGFLAGGGTVERMTLHEALTARPWALIEERGVWSAGYATLLARAAGAADKADRVARERHFEARLPRAQTHAPARRL